jgi:hypothetical protein
MNSRFLGLMAAGVLGLLGAAAPAVATTVDDFEAGLSSGIDSDGVLTGFHIFAGSGTATISTTSTPPASVPGAAAGNTVLQMDVDTDSFAGFVHVFEGTDINTLAPRDWSSYRAMTFWLYGSNTGNEMYIDVLDNRGGGSTYPFELWTSTFDDDFSGWQQLSFAFSDLTRKEIGNGAPNDGLGLTTVHGWALGTLATGGAQTYYVDDVRLVPEPGTLALLGLGLAGLGLCRRRKAH